LLSSLAVVVRPMRGLCGRAVRIQGGDLPAHFGAPPETRADVAVKVAATIMGCWTGD